MSIACIGGGNKAPAISHLLNHQEADYSQVLIIPSACSVTSAYERKVPATKALFDSLGVEATVLHEFGETPSRTKLQHEIGRATLLYTIGGNSPHMMKKIRDHGSDIELRKAIAAGTNHAGVSAGALLPFDTMHSNISARPAKEDWDFAYLSGIGVLRGVATAHAQKHDITMYGERPDSRLDNLKATMPPAELVGLAIDDGMAVIFGKAAALLPSQPESHAYTLLRVDEEVSVAAIEDVDQLAVYSK